MAMREVLSYEVQGRKSKLIHDVDMKVKDAVTGKSGQRAFFLNGIKALFSKWLEATGFILRSRGANFPVLNKFSVISIFKPSFYSHSYLLENRVLL